MLGKRSDGRNRTGRGDCGKGQPAEITPSPLGRRIEAETHLHGKDGAVLTVPFYLA